MHTRDVRGGAISSGAGRGEDENPRGGAKKRANPLIQKSKHLKVVWGPASVTVYALLSNFQIS